MERYHIFKLGLAILFYAAYCIRPMMVNCQESDNIIEDNHKNHTQKPTVDNYWVYIQGVDGKPGVDFPVYSYIPRTTFSCKEIESGYYADMETDCQVFHICEEGRKISFLCPNGTIFQQSELICEWWNKVNCTNSPNLYEESAERLQNDIARRKASRRVYHSGGETKHGAIMRIEEESSIRATQNGKEFIVRKHKNNGQSRTPKKINTNESKPGVSTTQNNQLNNNDDIYAKKISNSNQNIVASKRNREVATGNYINHNNNNNNDVVTKDTRKASVNNEYVNPQNTNKEYHVQFASTSSGITQNSQHSDSTTRNYYSSTSRKNTVSTSAVTEATVFKTSNSPNKIDNTADFSDGHSNAVRSTAGPYNNVKNNKVSPDRGTTKYYTSVGNQNPSSIKTNTNFPTTQKPKESPSLEIKQAREYPLGFPKHNSIQDVPSNHKIVPEVPQNDLDSESQVPQETSSFVKNTFNSIGDSNERKYTTPGWSYSNHRATYSEVKQPVTYTTSKFSPGISSITPHLVTTQPINNGKPFLGSRIGTNVARSTTTEEPTIIFGIVRHSTPETPSNDQTLNPFGPYSVAGTSPSPPSSSTTRSVPEEDSIKSIQNNNYNQPAGQFTVGSNSQPLSPSSAISAVSSEGSTDINNNYNQHLSQFNVGSTSKTLPPLSIAETVTNSVPTELFNLGSTDQPINPQVISTHGTTLKPLEISVPQHGTLNLGEGVAQVSSSSSETSTTKRTPVSEPPFVKKYVSALYSTPQPLVSSTKSYVDHATVYGTYSKSTVPPPNSNYFNNGVAVRFNKNSDRVGVQLSKSVGGSTSTANTKPPILLAKVYKGEQNQLRFGSTIQPPLYNINANVHLSDITQDVSPAVPDKSGFYVTKEFAPSSGTIQGDHPKPRPFQKGIGIEPRFIEGSAGNSLSQGNGRPYQISSARPFGISDAISSTAYTPTVPTTPSATPNPIPQTETPSIYENIDNMLHVLMEIANVQPDGGDYASETPRPGLIIPPSVGPQTLHSLAQYFAHAGNENATQALETLEPDMKEKLTTLLTAMTVHGYNNLFRDDNSYPSTADADSQDNTASSTPVPTNIVSETTTDSNYNINTDVQTRLNEENNETQNEIDEENSTTTSPNLRQLARNFSLALSSYLNDPVTFKKELEELRPTEPPQLQNERSGASDDQGSNDDELLNFSDADIRTRLPPVYPTTPTSYLTTTSPKPTWGYIIASKPLGSESTNHNSLNPDLNTADTQSFVPKFNSLPVNEGQNQISNNNAQSFSSSKKQSSTEIPIDHWTKSTTATELWRSTFSVNPAAVNDHFETTTVGTTHDQEKTLQNDDNYDEGPIIVPDVEPLTSSDNLPKIDVPESKVSYEIRALPPLSLNSTQVHGILINFMNSTKSDDTNRLQRILRKLNTTEDEFLTRMKTIEENPLTKGLILLLISECGADITKDLGLNRHESSKETLQQSNSGPVFVKSEQRSQNSESLNSSLLRLVDPNLKESDQDARALQLLNSLYTIASRFGRK